MDKHEEENLRGQLSDLAYRLEQEQTAHADTKTQLAGTQSELGLAKKAKADADAAMAKVHDGVMQLQELTERLGLLAMSEDYRKQLAQMEATNRLKKAQEDLDALSK